MRTTKKMNCKQTENINLCYSPTTNLTKNIQLGSARSGNQWTSERNELIWSPNWVHTLRRLLINHKLIDWTFSDNLTESIAPVWLGIGSGKHHIRPFWGSCKHFPCLFRTLLLVYPAESVHHFPSSLTQSHRNHSLWTLNKPTWMQKHSNRICVCLSSRALSFTKETFNFVCSSVATISFRFFFFFFRFCVWCRNANVGGLSLMLLKPDKKKETTNRHKVSLHPMIPTTSTGQILTQPIAAAHRCRIDGGSLIEFKIHKSCIPSHDYGHHWFPCFERELDHGNDDEQTRATR